MKLFYFHHFFVYEKVLLHWKIYNINAVDKTENIQHLPQAFVFPNFPRLISFESNSQIPFLVCCFLLFCDDCFILYNCSNFNELYSFAILDPFCATWKQQRTFSLKTLSRI